MARILGGGGKMPSRTVGRPGYSQFVNFGAQRKRVGLASRAASRGVRRLLARNPAKFQGDAPFGGPLSAATYTTAMAGSNNDLKFTAASRGTPGNSVRVRIVVAGASTALSVSVSGNDVTINSATSAGSAATSTAAQVKAAVNASAAARALLDADLAPGNDGTGVVAAFGYQTLTGGQQPAIQGSEGTPNPEIVKQSAESRRNVKLGRAGSKINNNSTNRNLRKR